MREDIAKAICERPRVHDMWGSRGQRTKDLKPIRKVKLELVEGILDDITSPSRGPMAKYGKDFSDLLAPLRGWARKQVGRPYDKAMSEVHRLLRGNGVSQAHALGHLKDYILSPNEIQIVNGKPFQKGFLGNVPVYRDELYGDPRDGIIKWGKSSKRRGTKLR